MSLLLTVVTTIISPFGVISHSDGGHIDLGVESHFYIIPVLRGIIIIDVRWNIILFGLNLHGRLHLCSVDGDIGTVVVVLPVMIVPDLDDCYPAFTGVDLYCWFCKGACSWRGGTPWHTPPVYSCGAEPHSPYILTW